MDTTSGPRVICPQCGREHIWSRDNKSRPFCSDRCKLIDLGKWANEDYRVQQPEIEQEEAELVRPTPIYHA